MRGEVSRTTEGSLRISRGSSNATWEIKIGASNFSDILRRSKIAPGYRVETLMLLEKNGNELWIVSPKYEMDESMHTIHWSTRLLSAYFERASKFRLRVASASVH